MPVTTASQYSQAVNPTEFVIEAADQVLCSCIVVEGFVGPLFVYC